MAPVHRFCRPIVPPRKTIVSLARLPLYEKTHFVSFRQTWGRKNAL